MTAENSRKNSNIIKVDLLLCNSKKYSQGPFTVETCSLDSNESYRAKGHEDDSELQEDSTVLKKDGKCNF